ncbi:MAG TPA: haloalkane dehalogenase [Gemmatimonadaceae bacterium]|nr:haloalkane dehalogenase [Gemmatimonadaceae bacterium]
MRVLRTPDHRFAGLSGYPFAPRYTDVEGVRIHHVDEGARDAPVVLLLHGEPTWSYLYRHMIPVLAARGLRAVAPDLPGFGRSDKPAAREDYSYARMVAWMRAWLDANALRDITLVCQDWGALIGLRLAAECDERVARVVVANGALPTGDRAPRPVFRAWQAFARATPWFPIGLIVRLGCRTWLDDDVIAGYRAPFPGDAYRQGARALPQLVPTRPDDPASAANRAAWEHLRQWRKPFLTAFSDGDPVFRGADRIFQRTVPGARDQPHVTIREAGHFLQEDAGPELARVVADFIARTR